MKAELHQVLEEAQRQCVELNFRPILLYPVLQNLHYLEQDEIDLIKNQTTTTQTHLLIFVLLKSKPEKTLLALQEIFHSQQCLDLYDTIQNKLKELGYEDLIWNPSGQVDGIKKMRKEFHDILDSLQKRCIELKINPIWLYSGLQNANLLTQNEIDYITNETTTTAQLLAIFSALKNKSEIVMLDLQKIIHIHSIELLKEIHDLLRSFDKDYLILQNIVSNTVAPSPKHDATLLNPTSCYIPPSYTYSDAQQENAREATNLLLNSTMLTPGRSKEFQANLAALRVSQAKRKQQVSQAYRHRTEDLLAQNTRFNENLELLKEDIRQSNLRRDQEIQEAVNIQIAKQIYLLKRQAAAEGKEVDAKAIDEVTAHLRNSGKDVASKGGTAAAVIRKLKVIWNDDS